MSYLKWLILKVLSYNKLRKINTIFFLKYGICNDYLIKSKTNIFFCDYTFYLFRIWLNLNIFYFYNSKNTTTIIPSIFFKIENNYKFLITSTRKCFHVTILMFSIFIF